MQLPLPCKNYDPVGADMDNSFPETGDIFFKSSSTSTLGWILKEKSHWRTSQEPRECLVSNKFNLIPTLSMDKSALFPFIWHCKGLWCHPLIFPTGPRQDLRTRSPFFVVLQDQEFSCLWFGLLSRTVIYASRKLEIGFQLFVGCR